MTEALAHFGHDVRSERPASNECARFLRGIRNCKVQAGLHSWQSGLQCRMVVLAHPYGAHASTTHDRTHAIVLQALARI